MGCDTFGRSRDISTETCIKRGQHCKATVLKVEVLTKKIDGASYRIVTPIDLFRRRTLTLPSVFPDEQRLVTVDIPAFDHSLIAKLIKTPVLVDELSRINIVLQKMATECFHFYTDGSIGNKAPFQTYIQGVKQNRSCNGRRIDQDVSFSCGIKYHPSSTRSELLAIMTALLAIPSNTELTIYTDSQAAIDGINRISDALNRRGRKLLKLNNYVILFTIHDLIITKSLKLNLIKVREHSGDYWNDMADEIAKNEREIAGIDRHIRSFTRFVAESLEEVQWSFNKQWRSYFEEDFSSTGWHWSSHWQNFNSINKERCTSFSTKNLYICQVLE
ncbi:unnamed protein product [Rhizophagus irregularis]|nr:unnamed protein product [Rhizophagus irregularis]